MWLICGYRLSMLLYLRYVPHALVLVFLFAQIACADNETYLGMMFGHNTSSTSNKMLFIPGNTYEQTSDVGTAMVAINFGMALPSGISLGCEMGYEYSDFNKISDKDFTIAMGVGSFFVDSYYYIIPDQHNPKTPPLGLYFGVGIGGFKLLEADLEYLPHIGNSLGDSIKFKHISGSAFGVRGRFGLIYSTTHFQVQVGGEILKTSDMRITAISPSARASVNHSDLIFELGARTFLDS